MERFKCMYMCTYIRICMYTYIYVRMSVAVELEFREGSCNMYVCTYICMGCCHSDLIYG